MEANRDKIFIIILGINKGTYGTLSQEQVLHGMVPTKVSCVDDGMLITGSMVTIRNETSMLHANSGVRRLGSEGNRYARR